MITALTREFGSRRAQDLVGVDAMTWNDWTRKRRPPTLAARKAVWLVWSLALHPEQVQSLWDIATYGRFHGQPMIEPPEPEYYI
jgi:hypothetical protein